MNPAKKILPHLFISILMIAFVRPLWSQNEIPVKVTPQNRTGDLPFTTSIGTEVEKVDILTGNLIVNIPFVSKPGRGMGSNVGIYYNALLWRSAPRVNMGIPIFVWTPEEREGIALGWNETRPRLSKIMVVGSCNGFPSYSNQSYMFHDGTGAKHLLAIKDSVVGCDPVYYDQGPDLTAAGIWADRVSGKVILADGTQITPSGTDQFQDANGNKKSTGTSWVDTLGQTSVTITTNSTQRLYSVPDSGGTQRTYTVNFGSLAINTSFGINLCGRTTWEYSGTQSVVNSVVLPNNQTYQFQYEPSFGAITRIDLPTGGYITYTWATVQDATSDIKTHRRVASRTVNVNGQASTWTFNETSTGVVTMTDPNNNQAVFTKALGDVLGSAKFYQGTAAGTPLRQYNMSYQGDALPGPLTWANQDNSPCPPDNDPIAPRLYSISTILEDGTTSSSKTFVYETFNYSYPPQPGTSGPLTFSTSRGNVSEIWEYDYGGGLVRKTTKSYLHNANAGYLPYNIVNKVINETIYDAGGAQIAKTDYEYDSTALTSVTGAPQHDDASFPATFTFRGNLTKVNRWRNLPSVATLTTTYIYDTLGNITSITDPLTHTTSYTYDDSFSGGSCLPPSNSRAFVTQASNHLTFRTQFTYYPCTGLTSAKKDENDILNTRAGTTFTYDLMNRPLQTSFPDGGLKTLTYTDTVPVKVATTTKLTSTTNITSDVEFDGLGRSRKTRLTSDPQGTIYGRTAYDNLGRAYQTWNPTRCDPDIGSCSEKTYGYTETQFDAIGRVIKVIPPDGSVSSNNITTGYLLNTTTVTDQASKARKSFTDALGRLTQVIEDPGSLAYSTTYSYDVLDNLTGVSQVQPSEGTQNRSFTYNSLSQLLTATNPESGTVSYTYDNDGNLQTRTDARGNVTTHVYDGIHRINSKSYSIVAPTATTQNVSYTYDNLATNCNSKGRLTLVDNTDSKTNIQCYDAMGRVTQGNQVTKAGSPLTDYTYPFTNYIYNSAGMMTSETLPSGKVIGTSIDTAGRVAGVYKTGAYYVGAVETDATNRILYAPQGAIAQMRLGTGLWDQTRFNKRLQPTQMGVGQTTTGLDTDLTTTYANRLLLGNCYSNVDPNCSGAGTANNNGNVLRQKIQATSLSLTQVFAYDPLNRLDSASESGGGTPWAQDYDYGRFGNRAVVGPTDYIPAPALTPISIAAYNGNTNKRNSVGYAYDASGNMITEATTRTMTYDAENRMVTFNGGSGTTTYTYDGDGRRVKKVDNGNVNSIYVYDALRRMAAEYSSAAFSGPGGTSYISGDHLGNTRLVINPDYSVKGRHDYLPFGEEIGTGYGSRGSIFGYGGIDIRQKFTSKERDSESNLDFFLARYFSGPQGRFMTPDWSVKPQPVPYADLTNPQTLNLYSYVINNPLNRTDPLGHDWFYVDEKWKWQKGHVYHDAKGNTTKDKGYADCWLRPQPGRTSRVQPSSV
ncbi:MAG: RHS repeat-associated core domain-containing protein [Terriglobia bacterium]